MNRQFDMDHSVLIKRNSRVFSSISFFVMTIKTENPKVRFIKLQLWMQSLSLYVIKVMCFWFTYIFSTFSAIRRDFIPNFYKQFFLSFLLSIWYFSILYCSFPFWYVWVVFREEHNFSSIEIFLEQVILWIPYVS